MLNCQKLMSSNKLVKIFFQGSITFSLFGKTYSDFHELRLDYL